MILTVLIPSRLETLPFVAGPILPWVVMRFSMGLLLDLADIYKFLEPFLVEAGNRVLF